MPLVSVYNAIHTLICISFYKVHEQHCKCCLNVYIYTHTHTFLHRYHAKYILKGCSYPYVHSHTYTHHSLLHVKRTRCFQIGRTYMYKSTRTCPHTHFHIRSARGALRSAAHICMNALIPTHPHIYICTARDMLRFVFLFFFPICIAHEMRLDLPHIYV